MLRVPGHADILKARQTLCVAKPTKRQPGRSAFAYQFGDANPSQLLVVSFCFEDARTSVNSTFSGLLAAKRNKQG